MLVGSLGEENKFNTTAEERIKVKAALKGINLVLDMF